MAELDARKQSILRALVVEYVSSAEPVGSEALVLKYDLGVRSATVRSALAEMLESGYVEQPHTSAGRIPSDAGYRYYVDRLITAREADEGLRARLADTARRGEALQELLRESVRALSRATQLLGVATVSRDPGLSVRAAFVSALGPSQALLVLALSNGAVENRMLELPAGATLQDLGRVNEALEGTMREATLASLARSRAPGFEGFPAAERLAATVWSMARAVAKSHTRGALVVEGEEFFLAQPEFRRDLGRVQELLGELTSGDTLYDAVAGPDASGTQRVIIGREHRNDALRNLSVVRHAFRIGDQEAGVVAVIGPTRMRYARGLPMVEHTADALSRALTRFLG